MAVRGTVDAGAGGSLVTSVTGTTNKVTASPTTGAVVLTLPDGVVLVGPVLGTPASGVATNLTGTAAGLTAGTASAVAVGGITGLGTGVATALAINVGTAGAPVVLNGALGTPSSGTGTNITGVNAATLGGATFAAPGAIGGGTPSTGAFTTLSSTGTFTPSQTNGIVGTTTNNAANAGSVGEVLTATAAGVSLTTGTAATVCSQAFTAGDWDISCTFIFTGGATTTVSRCLGSLSTTDNTTNSTIGFRNDVVLAGVTTPFNFGNPGVLINAQPVKLAGTVTYYAVAVCDFAVSTATVSAIITGRRRR